MFSALVGIFSTVLGEPPPEHDTEMLEKLLYGFGAHGLVEAPAPGVAPVLAEGAGALAEALALVVQAGILDVPVDMSESELDAALEFGRSMGVALAALPDGPMRHYLGGDGVVGFWQPDDPQKVALLLIWLFRYAGWYRLIPSRSSTPFDSRVCFPSKPRHRCPPPGGLLRCRN